MQRPMPLELSELEGLDEMQDSLDSSDAILLSILVNLVLNSENLELIFSSRD